MAMPQKSPGDEGAATARPPAPKKKPKKPARITIREEWCKGCEICVEFCPTKVLAMKDQKAVVVNLEACTRCALCEHLCPDFAIEVE